MSAAGEVEEGMGVTSGPLGLHLLGILCAHEGRYDEAEEAFLRAVRADPEMAGSYVELGLVYACHGEYPKMVEALGQTVKAGSGGVRAYLGSQPLGDLAVAPEPGIYGHTRQGGGGKSDAVTPLVAALSYLAGVTKRRRACWSRRWRVSRPARHRWWRCSH